MIAGEARRVRSLADTLEAFAGSGVPSPESQVDVNEIVRAAAALLESEIEKATDRFLLHLGKGLPRVSGNAPELEQALVHLIMNALQALPDRGREVRVFTSMHADLDCVEICVRDEGEGMVETDLKRLMEPFFTTRRGSGGSGLGLFLCRAIVRKHRGSMIFRSAAGKGTTVRVFLPASAEGTAWS